MFGSSIAIFNTALPEQKENADAEQNRDCGRAGDGDHPPKPTIAVPKCA